MRRKEIVEKLEPARTCFHFIPGVTGGSLCRFGWWGRDLVGLVMGLVILVVSLGNWWLSYRQSRATHPLEVWILGVMGAFARKNRRMDMFTLLSYFAGISVLWVAWYWLPAWLVSFPAILVATVDPAGKFGKFDRLYIYRFRSGVAKGKSIGGFLAGLIVGVVASYVWISTFIWREGFLPAPAITIAVTYVVGVVSAAVAELLSGDFDNFAIQVASLVAMVTVYSIFF